MRKSGAERAHSRTWRKFVEAAYAQRGWVGAIFSYARGSRGGSPSRANGVDAVR
jgi:hypothetical protein